jgi:hypothetical protein
LLLELKVSTEGVDIGDNLIWLASLAELTEHKNTIGGEVMRLKSEGLT